MAKSSTAVGTTTPTTKNDTPKSKGNRKPDEFRWVGTDEPHRTRRKDILEKHPEVKALYGHDHSTALVALAVVVTMLCTMRYVADASWTVFFLLAYTVGGVCNHNLALAIHELSHGLAFKKLSHNRMFAIFANFPMIVPYAMSFQQYHLEHHVYQGDEIGDVDIPSEWEASFFFGTLGKTVWMFFQPLFYAFRPVVIRPKKPTFWIIVNFVTQITFDLAVLYFYGIKPLLFGFVSLILGMGLHPMAGHFISEHYVFTEGHETYSYYGIMNLLAYNVGYHNEHHDFPRVPGSRLPSLKSTAHEFYDNLPSYSSWTGVVWKFLTDPSVSLYSRVKRKTKLRNQGSTGGDVATTLINKEE